MKAGGSCLAGLLCLSAPAIAQQADRPAIDTRDTQEGRTILALVEALKAKDLAAAQKLLAAKFVMPRRWKNCFSYEDDRTCFDRMLRDTLITLDGRIELQKLRVERNIVRINVALSNQSTIEEGAQRVLLTDEFVVEDGRIQSFIRTPRTEDPQTRAYFRNRHSER